MELPADYERIRKEVMEISGFISGTVSNGICSNAVRDAVERCYKLHSKPPKELTDAEIDDIYKMKTGGMSGVISRQFAKAIEAAVWAKQSEPERVKFRAARNKVNGEAFMAYAEQEQPDGAAWEWLEPEQAFEVVLP